MSVPKPTLVDLILDASVGGKALLKTLSIDVTTAGTFKLVNGSTRQIFELFNYKTSATAEEGLRIKSVAGANFEIGTFQGSATGSIRSLSFGYYGRATPTLLTRTAELNLSTGEMNVWGGIFQVRRYGNNATASQFVFKKYRGTEGVGEVALLNNDLVGQLLFQGYNGASLPSASAIQAQAAADFTTTSNPVRLLMSTTPAGSTSGVNRFVITESGLINIGPWSTATPLASLVTLVGNNSSSAETNSLRFHDTSIITGIGQVLGKIEFYSGDGSVPGPGVKAWIAGVTESASVANASIVFATDTNTGTATERMRIKHTGIVQVERLLGQTTEVVNTPAATTQTITLESGRLQTLSLVNSTGTVTATLTVPTIAAEGSILVKQHATTARSITWAVSSGSIKWLGTQPTWGSDAAGAVRNVRWRWDGSVMHLEASAAG